MLKKVLATLIASAFTASVFAQAPAQSADSKAPAATTTEKAPAKKHAKAQKKAHSHVSAKAKTGGKKGDATPEAGK